MRPTEPGTYRGRLITYGLGNTRLPSRVEDLEVVAGGPNPRGHALLVKLCGTDLPKYRSLDCYEWDKP